MGKATGQDVFQAVCRIVESRPPDTPPPILNLPERYEDLTEKDKVAMQVCSWRINRILKLEKEGRTDG